MRTSSLARRSVIPVIAVAGLLAAGCSSSSSSSGGGGSSNQGSGSASSVSMSKLASDVNTAASIPTFATYAADYGSKVSTSGLSGKKLMILPGDSALAACQEIAQATSAIAKEVGMVPTIFSNQGTTAEYNTAIEDAIHQKYAAIAAGCDFDPSQVAPAFKQAEKAGIAVSVYGATPQEAQEAGVTYNNVDPYDLDATIAAEQAVEQHQGKPFHAIAITSNAAPATKIMQDALTAELKKICSGCTMTDVNVEVPNWQSDIASATSQALLQNPDVTVLFPDYAGMLTYMLAGIQSAHRSTNIKAYLAFGGGTPFVQLQTQQPGKSIIQSDIGGYPPWTGYLMFLQAVRALDHDAPIAYNKAIGPDRVVTPQNAVQVLETGGWGTDWVNGFRGLLGLPTLSGKALTDAATLNGAMTAKP